MPISDYLKNDEIYLAHKDGKSKSGAPKRPETIEAHSSLALYYAKKIIEVKKLQPVIEEIGKSFFDKGSESFNLWQKMFFDAIYLHDLGKANTDFQSLKMENDKFPNSSPNRNSEHSFLSASLYFSKYLEQIKGQADKKTLSLFILINCFVISKHHSYLNSFSDFLADFSDPNKFYKNYAKLLPDISLDFSVMGKEIVLDRRKSFAEKSLEDFEKTEKCKTIDLYIYAKLLYSLLVSADFYATADYMNDFRPNNPEDFGVIVDADKFLNPFAQTDVYKSIQKYSQNRKSKDFENINEARSELFLETEENLLKNLDKNLFYLEAPTGSGKTNTAVNLSLKIVKECANINKIFYVFPFNTLVEQTKNTLLKSFGDNAKVGSDIGIINSISPIYVEDEKTDKVKNSSVDVDYTQILLGRQFLHYPIILTTHVKLFDWLFGLGRESHFPLCQLANSVVILDEIQSYKNSIWKEIAIFLNKFAKALNIKFIIMSATLPKIGALIPESDANEGEFFQDLVIDRKKYFESKWFKDRVVPDFALINVFKVLSEDEKVSLLQERIFEEYKNGNDVLVEFIIKKRSLSSFKDFKERYRDKIPQECIRLLNGDDNAYTRDKIIAEAKNENRNYNIVLFSTQVIEAGVDVDFDVGFKDISILDSEEQFMGRINRSCKKHNCRVYFFNLDDKRIYNEDMRIDFTLESPDIQEKLIEKDFNSYYASVLKKIEEYSKKNISNNFDMFRRDCLQPLDFHEIQERLKLIKDEASHTIFLNRNIQIDDGKELVGSEIWQKYKDLLNNFEISYAEKKVELSKVNNELSYFTYSVRKMAQNYNDVIGDIYYFENGSNFLTEDGKFDREKFENSEVDYEFL